MTDKLKQVAKEEIEKLAKENQQAITSLNWAEISEKIGKNFLLTEEEINDLQAEVLIGLLGLASAATMTANIEGIVGTKNEAEKISEEIFQKIFTPIRETIIENLKKSDRVKNSNYKQTLDFILSSGDYSVFLEKKSAAESNSGTPETKLPPKPIKMTDIKSKLVI